MKHKTLPEIIARDLRNRIENDPESTFASLEEMSLRYGVSYATMQKAAALLADEGLIETSQGRKTRIVRPGWPSYDESPRALQLAEKVRRRIENGVYRTGQPLPKQSYFTLTDKVSSKTVASALRLIGEQDLIHKVGKKWVVGPRKTAAMQSGPGRIAQSNPVVLILTPWEPQIYQFFNNPHTSSFSFTFREELHNNGRLLTALPMIRPAESGDRHPYSFGEVEKRIRELGSRFEGVLVHAHPDPINRLDEWWNVLGIFGRPIVYFDGAGEAHRVTRSGIGLARNFYRVFADEDGAADVAAGALTDAGHTRIGIPYPDISGNWAAIRAEKLKKAILTRNPRANVVTVKLTESGWDPESRRQRRQLHIQYYQERVKRKKRMIRSGGRLRRNLLSSTPSLRSLIDDNVSALIALNDALAQQIYTALTDASLAVPRDISMVSFDNTPESISYPISTVDFGLGRLGYLAAHIFIGDIPVRSDAEGRIAGKCTLVDRGSIRRRR